MSMTKRPCGLGHWLLTPVWPYLGRSVKFPGPTNIIFTLEVSWRLNKKPCGKCLTQHLICGNNNHDCCEGTGKEGFYFLDLPWIWILPPHRGNGAPLCRLVLMFSGLAFSLQASETPYTQHAADHSACRLGIRKWLQQSPPYSRGYIPRPPLDALDFQ